MLRIFLPTFLFFIYTFCQGQETNNSRSFDLSGEQPHNNETYFAAVDEEGEIITDPDLVHFRNITFADGGQFVGNWSVNAGMINGTMFLAVGGGAVYEGPFINNTAHGEGKITTLNYNYTGSFAEGLPHGKGIYNYSDGASYHGDIVRNRFHGYGTYVRSFGDQYIGVYDEGVLKECKIKFANGALFNGNCLGLNMINGTVRSPNGDLYKGEFVNNLYEGQGMFKCRQFIYNGQFKAGQADGYGVYNYTDDNSYAGGVLAGKLSGWGVYTFADGERYEGMFANGDGLHGECIVNFKDRSFFVGNCLKFERKSGTFYYHHKEKYEGDFLDNYRHGVGTHTTVNGDEYQGFWNHDGLTGDCVVNFVKGHKFQGTCRDMKIFKGIMHYANGDKYEGKFHNNQMHGEGSYFNHTSGETFHGSFNKGKRIVRK